jgi:hypothetical protein
MRCETCGGRVHRSKACYHGATVICPACFAAANGWRVPRRAAARLRAATYGASFIGGVILAGTGFDTWNAGDSFGAFYLVAGLGLAFIGCTYRAGGE